MIPKFSKLYSEHSRMQFKGGSLANYMINNIHKAKQKNTVTQYKYNSYFKKLCFKTKWFH